jgi:uncharacterized membrane protein
MKVWVDHMVATLLNAQSPIPLHAICALAALVVGGMQMFMQKGTALHIAAGRLWVALMTIVAMSSFFIYDLKVWGDYSPIHILSAWTLLSLGAGIYFIRKGDIRHHKFVMTSLFYLALVLTGAFTLLPGRLMNTVLFQ